MSRRYVLKSGLIETELAKELILLDPETQEMFSLNGTGRWVWRELPSQSADQLAVGLATLYAITPAQAREDVESLVAQLLEAGLIQSLSG